MKMQKVFLKTKFTLLCLWTFVILSQVLKTKFYFIYYPLFFFILSIIAFFIFKKGIFIKGNNFFRIQIWFFYFLLLYVNSITFIYGDLNDFLKAFPRMMVMPLTLFFFINLITEEKNYISLINILIFFSIIASLSLIYQVYMGPLDFLVESQTRSGLPRYASTFGSLTIFGGAVGIITLLVVTSNLNIFIKYIIVTLFLISAFLTLAKAAIMNILIVTIFSIFFLNIRNKKLLVLLITISLICIKFILPEIGTYIGKSLEVIGASSGKIDLVSNSSLYQQILKRVFYSVDYLKNFNLVEIFFGFGLIGGQGVFGLPYSFAGTTHNQFMDLYLIGGVFLFLNVVFIVISLMIELNKLKNKNFLAEIFFYSNWIAIINMFFFNGFIFQPITSFVFWLSIVYVLSFKKKPE